MKFLIGVMKNRKNTERCFLYEKIQFCAIMKMECGMEIIKEIFEKWKVDYEDKYVTILCNTDHIQKDTKLHYFYKPVDMPKLFKKMKWYLPKDLKEFYKNFNGMRLFFSSFCIYGVQSCRFETRHIPFDIIIENFSRSKNKDYIIFGTILGCYYFVYKNDKRSKGYYKIDADDWSILKQYDSLDQLLTEELTPYMEEYNLDGTRKHPIKSSISDRHPHFAHKFTGIKTWETEKHQ